MERGGAGWPLSGKRRRAGAEVTEKVRLGRLPHSQRCWCLGDCGDHGDIMAKQTEQREEALGLESQALSGTVGDCPLCQASTSLSTVFWASTHSGGRGVEVRWVKL